MSESRIALTLLTGFLGAGKTTLLNGLLRHPALSGTLVVVNEIGDVSLDHHLMEQAAGDVIALPGGCLCCTVRSDLIETLEDIGKRVRSGVLGPLRRVVIETTGLANPAPLLQSILGHSGLRRTFELDGVVTVVDAVNALGTVDEFDEARCQIAVADRLVLTKTSHAEARSDAVTDMLTHLAPHARILDAGDGIVAPVDLFDIAPRIARASAAQWAAAGVNAGHGDIRATTFWSDRPLPPAGLGFFSDFLRSPQGQKVLRLKGLVRTTDDPDRPLVIHGVQHLFDRPHRLDAWPDDDKRTRIVVIARDLDPSLIAALYDAFAGIAPPS